MDPRRAEDTLKHLEKQHELLTESHRAMTQELQKLQVEEQMMMDKFLALMNAHDLNKSKKGPNVGEGMEMVVASSSSALVTGDGTQ